VENQSEFVEKNKIPPWVGVTAYLNF